MTTTTTQSISITINGRQIGPTQVPADLPMIDFLNEHLNMTGTHLGCGMGICRACVVIVDEPGQPSQEMPTCITPATTFDGKSIRTIEAHSKKDDTGKVIWLSPVQNAFLKEFAFQCGYCTSGFVNAATILMENLQKKPIPPDQVEAAIDEALGGHICRCTGYVRYFSGMKKLILSTPGLVMA